MAREHDLGEEKRLQVPVRGDKRRIVGEGMEQEREVEDEHRRCGRLRKAMD